MKSKFIFTLTSFALSGIVQAASIHPILPDSGLNWKDSKHVPPGAQVAILSGDPTKKGEFIARIKLPANYTIPPHSHPVNEYDTVLSGTLYLGTGYKLDTNKGTALPAGSYVEIPSKAVHYTWTKEETILQISGIGPWGTQYVDKTLNKKYS